VRFITVFGRGFVCLGCDGDFHGRTGFEADLLTLFIRQRVVDAYFDINDPRLQRLSVLFLARLEMGT
jgi:hypothetical protein